MLLFKKYCYLVCLSLCRDVATQVQNKILSRQALLCDGECQANVIDDEPDDIKVTAVDIVHSDTDEIALEAIPLLSDTSDQPSHRSSAVDTNVEGINYLKPLNIEICDKCERSCVMCSLQKAQFELHTAIKELNEPRSSSQYCSCRTHRHIQLNGCSEV